MNVKIWDENICAMYVYRDTVQNKDLEKSFDNQIDLGKFWQMQTLMNKILERICMGGALRRLKWDSSLQIEKWGNFLNFSQSSKIYHSNVPYCISRIIKHF